MSALIKRFIKDYRELNEFLIENSRISESTEINNHYKKILLLSCASQYEAKITGLINSFVESNCTDQRICEFLRNKAIKRQYHTYFDWNQTNNINHFLGLFGGDFKNIIAKEIKDNSDLARQVQAFLEIGSERNKMVHQNFLDYNLEKTFDEIKELHEQATSFIEYMENVFSE